jgi:hypothetical protein
MTAHRTPLTVKVAAVSLMSDAGFGIAMPIALAHVARRGELPMTPWGFRAFSGPFEQLGPERFAALGLVLIGVCTLDVISGIWLWQGRQRGATLGLAMTPLALGLGAGFALPFLLVPAPIRAALVLRGRRRLR